MASLPLARRDGRFGRAFLRRMAATRYLHLMILPGLIYFAVFHYAPIYGIVIAFKDYAMRRGILGSPWASPFYRYFERFVSHPYFFRLLRNTILLNAYSLLFSFPVPILFALLLNEMRSHRYKKIVQTVSYMPNFISTVAMVGMLTMMLSPSAGFVNGFLQGTLGLKPIYFMSEPGWFRTIYIASDIWQHTGWNAIIYLAALSGISPELYEVATIDGAGRLQKMWHISLKGITPTVVILLILRVGSMLSVGSEKILLMYSPLTYEVADVLSSFVYRIGFVEAQYSFSTAINLFSSVVNVLMLTGANALSRRLSESSLW